MHYARSEKGTCMGYSSFVLALIRKLTRFMSCETCSIDYKIFVFALVLLYISCGCFHGKPVMIGQICRQTMQLWQ